MRDRFGAPIALSGNIPFFLFRPKTRVIMGTEAFFWGVPHNSDCGSKFNMAVYMAEIDPSRPKKQTAVKPHHCD